MSSRWRVLGVVVAMGVLALAAHPHLPAAAAPFDVAAMSIEPQVQEVALGAPFTVRLHIDAGTELTRGGAARIDYSEDLVTISSVTEYQGPGSTHAWAAAHDGYTMLNPPPSITQGVSTWGGTGVIEGQGANVAGLLVIGAPAQGASGSVDLMVVSGTCGSVPGVAQFDIIVGQVADEEASPFGTVNRIGGAVYCGMSVALPELQVTDLNAVAVPGGNDYNVSFRISNSLGTLEAGPTVARLVIDGVTVAELPVEAVAAGAASETITYGPITVSGEGDVVSVTADYGSAVVERNEANNVATRSYTVGSPLQDVVIQASFGAMIDIDPPANVLSDWDLEIEGNNALAGALGVKCNTHWQVDVSPSVEMGQSGWHMRQYTEATSEYGTAQLTSPLHVVCAAEGTDVSEGGPTMIASGDVGAQSGDAGEDHTIEFRQDLAYSDSRLPGGDAYRIVLTFTGYPTI